MRWEHLFARRQLLREVTKLDERLALLVAGLRRKLKLGPPDSAVETHPRSLNGASLWVRPGTTDVGTIVHDLVRGEHLPPLEVDGIRMAVELGSNIGTGLVGLATRYPEATVIGVEPDPESFALAQRNTAQFGERCIVIETAIWDREADLCLQGNLPSGLIAVEADRHDNSPGRTVRARTVDELLDEVAPGEAVDYMILNLEGAERRVLEAGGSWISRVRMIRTELHPEKGFDGGRCLALLQDHGFEAWLEPEWWGGWGFGVRRGGKA